MATPSRHVWSRSCPRAALPLWLAGCLLLTACGTSLSPNAGPNPHLAGTAADSAGTDSSIPAIVSPVPLVPAPTAAEEPELYSVVAQDVPVRDLLFNLARDAAINVDVHPSLTGLVTLNAIDQSLPQILERLARQSDIRWRFDAAGNLVVEPDSPYWVTYPVDYVNVQRTATTTSAISTSIVANVGGAAGGGAGGGGGGGAGGAGGGRNNNSTSNLTQNSDNNFWATLSANLSTLLGEVAGQDVASSIIANPESGVVSVRGTARQHEAVAAFINDVETRSLYQVLIEATVVEVNLSDDYQSGVDWATLARDNGRLNFIQNSLGGNLANAPTNVLTLDSGSPDAITATISMLSQFGESRVLSSPKLMVLNNQTAMLRAADNTVYFTIDVEPGVANANGGATPPVYTSVVNTVPIGFVMTVTPQIGANDQVTLNVRPTISRVLRYVDDPNPILAEAGVTNSVPEIQVREMESVLKVFSGQIAILGGLMQDSLRKDINGLPGATRLPVVRNLFGYREENATKTELIIFIRPVVVRQPSLDGDLQDYRDYLPANGLEAESAAINTSVLPAGLRAQPQ